MRSHERLIERSARIHRERQQQEVRRRQQEADIGQDDLGGRRHRLQDQERGENCAEGRRRLQGLIAGCESAAGRCAARHTAPRHAWRVTLGRVHRTCSG